MMTRRRASGICKSCLKTSTGEERKIILAAAAQICLACAQMKAEEKRCQAAYQEAFQQEHALQEELGALVRQMMELEGEGSHR